jgi:hypothetical protein
MPEAHPHHGPHVNRHRFDYQPDERDYVPPMKKGEAARNIRDWTGI